MKFLSCNIENFGKLHNYSVDFSEGTNIICENNGWGKSTFAAFIKVMFYGFDGEKKRSYEENERKRYMPWQGGIYGGSLVFEIDNKQYRVTRIFKDKLSNDEFELRYENTNMISNDFTENLGKEIFKIDRESFMRTLFIGQSDCNTNQTDDINAKIGNLSDNTNDINNFDTASAKLMDILNSLTPKRATGSLSKRKSQISEAEQEIRNGEMIKSSLNQVNDMMEEEQKKLEDFQIQIKYVKNKVKEVTSLQEVLAKKDEWERLKQKKVQKEAVSLDAKSFFSKEVPKKEDVKKQIAKVGELDRTSEKIEMNRLTDGEKEKFGLLNQKFGDYSSLDELSDEEISRMISKASKYLDLQKSQLSNSLTDEEKHRYDELNRCFKQDNNDVESMIGKWNERNTKNAAIPSNQVALSVLKTTMNNQKNKSPVLIVVIIGIVLTLLVIGLAFPIQVFFVACIIGLLLGAGLVLFGLKSNSKNSDTSEVEKMQQAIDRDLAYVAQIEGEVKSYIESHNRVYDPYSAGSILQEIYKDYMEYNRIREKINRQNNTTVPEEMDTLSKEIARFLGAYHYPLDESKFMDTLHELKEDLFQYRSLAARQNNYIQLNKNAKILETEIEEFLKVYGFVKNENLDLQLEEIQEKIDLYSRIKEDLNELDQEIHAFETKYDVEVFNTFDIEENIPSLDELHEEEDAIQAKQEECKSVISEYIKQLEQLQEQYDNWEEIKNRLKELQDEQHYEQEKFNYVSLAKKKLEDAKEAITSKYSKPILESFVGYYNLINTNNNNTFYVDANTNITVEEYGKQREIITQSFGCKDLISICLRIALVDAMYKEEKPVLIFDDPFTNLDDEKTKDAMCFLEKLGLKYQIVYFTCSNSRV